MRRDGRVTYGGCGAPESAAGSGLVQSHSFADEGLEVGLVDLVGSHFRTMRDRFNDPDGTVSFTVSIRGGYRANILVDLEE